MPESTYLRDFWSNLLSGLTQSISKQTEDVERAVSFLRIREQLWDALDNSPQSSDGWIYPIDVYVDNDNSLFSIVTQNGKLYRVGLNIEGETLTLGDWIQVTEVFQPVEQNRFIITRQADGRHRWLFIAATSVINRVGEIDSMELFDTFVEYANENDFWPRVDFYHLGDSDPELWEFGTADYLARDGCCYIATGLFDEDHPLAQATIRAYEEDPEKWGCSIEFYALAERELITVEPDVQVPVYKRGKNTRISIVREKDAAGLFTRIGIAEETQRMNQVVVDALKELFGDDEETVKQFVEKVDGVNRTIKDEKLITRTAGEAEEEEADSEAEAADETEEEDKVEQTLEVPLLELDDEALQVVTQQILESEAWKPVAQAIEAMQAKIVELETAADNDRKEITRLSGVNKKLVSRLQALEKDDAEKLEERLSDLPKNKRPSMRIGHRPSMAYSEGDGEFADDFAEKARETLSALPSYQ